MFHVDGQTDMTKLVVAFHNFGNAPEELKGPQMAKLPNPSAPVGKLLKFFS